MPLNALAPTVLDLYCQLVNTFAVLPVVPAPPVTVPPTVIPRELARIYDLAPLAASEVRPHVYANRSPQVRNPDSSTGLFSLALQEFLHLHVRIGLNYIHLPVGVKMTVWARRPEIGILSLSGQTLVLFRIRLLSVFGDPLDLLATLSPAMRQLPKYSVWTPSSTLTLTEVASSVEISTPSND